MKPSWCDHAAEEMDMQVVVIEIPRDDTIQLCEEQDMTVLEGARRTSR
jgi:hypothetical protein